MGYTFDFHPLTFIGTYLIIVLIVFTSFFISKKNISSKERFYILSFIFYLLSLFKFTMLPITYLYAGHKVHYPNLYQNLIPFKTIVDTFQHGNHIQNVGNVLLLLPLPILLQLISQKKYSFLKAFTTCLIVSMSIETAQCIIDLLTQYPNKVVDIDDVILNGFGGILGWFIYKKANQLPFEKR